jgi:hypothetical protein
MALNDAGKNALLDSGKTGIAYLALHSGAVGSGSGNEVSGGTPAYARKAASWGAAAGGVTALSAQVTFDVPAAASVTRVGYWSAVTGGTFLGDEDVTDESFGAQGTYTITAGSITLT